MTRNRWIILIVLTIAVFGGLAALASGSGLDVSKIDTNTIIPANTKAGKTNIAIGDHVYGNTSGKVMLTEYGDIQCPYCGELHPQLTPLVNYYKDSLTFVFRNFPLKTVHPNALAAATAAEAAGLQGASDYWAMNNKLYDTQSEWENASTSARTTIFEGYAKTLGLNVSKFTTDLSSNDVSTKINFDIALGNKLGVNSTPTLYLQGKNIANDTSSAVSGDTSELETDIRNAIKAAGLSLPAKTYAESQSS